VEEERVSIIHENLASGGGSETSNMMLSSIRSGSPYTSGTSTFPFTSQPDSTVKLVGANGRTSDSWGDGGEWGE